MCVGLLYEVSKRFIKQKTLWYWPRDREIDQWNDTESLEIGLSIHGNQCPFSHQLCSKIGHLLQVFVLWDCMSVTEHSINPLRVVLAEVQRVLENPYPD